MANARGIDVSHWQTPTWSTAGQSFAFIQAANGSDKHETSFTEHERRAKAAGVYVIPYLYARGVPVPDQVNALLSVAPGYRDYAVDYEGDSRGNSVSNIQMREIIRRLHTAGKRVTAYAGLAMMKDWGQDAEWFVDFGPVSAPPSWRFRQHKSGQSSGNEYNGSEADFQKWIGADMEHLHVVADTPHRITVKADSPIYNLDGSKIGVQQARVDRKSPYRTHVGPKGTSYWVTTTGIGGDQTLVLFGPDDVIDNGAIVDTGPDAGDVAAARAAGFADAKAKATTAVGGI